MQTTTRPRRPQPAQSLVLALLLSAATATNASAQGAKIFTPQDLFQRNVGTKEQQERQFPPHKIIGSMGVNPGTRLVNNPNNPTIAEEYARGFKVMHALPCDVPLGSHGAMYNMTAKHAKVGAGGPNPFIDPQGYKSEIDLVEGVFTSVLAEQRKESTR